MKVDFLNKILFLQKSLQRKTSEQDIHMYDNTVQKAVSSQTSLQVSIRVVLQCPDLLKYRDGHLPIEKKSYVQ